MQELSKILETSLGGYSLSRILSAVLTLLVCLIVSRLLLKPVSYTHLFRRLPKPVMAARGSCGSERASFR